MALFFALAPVSGERSGIVARKGDLKPYKTVNVVLDEAMRLALEESARRNERRLTEEVRYAVRKHLQTEAPVAAMVEAGEE
jgi:hypothetical protein